MLLDTEATNMLEWLASYFLGVLLLDQTLRSCKWRKWFLVKEAVDGWTKSPHQYHRKCIGNKFGEFVDALKMTPL